MKKHIYAALLLVIVGSMLLSSCMQATPETIIETVVVEKEGETIVEEKVVYVTEEPEEEVDYLLADGDIACKPLPDGSFTTGSVANSSVIAENDANQSQAQKVYGMPVPQATGKIYRVGVFEDVSTLNFWSANGPDNTIWNSFMLPPRLTMYYLSDKYFTMAPLVATEMPDPLVQEGDFWVTEIPMRQDITWSDGVPFTAKDVAFTANASVKLGLVSGNWSTWYDGNFLDRVEAVDDYTVKYYYHTKPGLARHESGTLQAPILAEHYWAPVLAEAVKPIDELPTGAASEDLLAAQAAAHDIIFAHAPDGEPVAGAFNIGKWETGAFLEETAVTDYIFSGMEVKQYPNGAYEDSNGIKLGTPEGEPLVVTFGPYVDAVVYTVYSNQDSAILALKEGEVDFVLNSLGLTKGLAAQLANEPSLTVLNNNTNGFRFMSFNMRRRPMNDCAFRQAVALLVDKEFITQKVLGNAAFPIHSFVPEGNAAWYYDGTPKIGLGLDREKRIQYAVQILQDAGYTWEGGEAPYWDAENQLAVVGGNLIMPDGIAVPEIELWAPSEGYDYMRYIFAINIETWLQDIGIPVVAKPAGFNVLIPLIFVEQDFDMYILGWSLGIFPNHLWNFFNAEQTGPDGNNAGGYINQEFEDLAVQLLTCDSYEACKEISDQVQNKLATDLPYVLLFDTGIAEAYRNDVLSYPYTEQLSGLQFTHQSPFNTAQTEVHVK
ncbi:MAG: ABC transporter substrate-binding protein [Chloroflexi bacterium]|nr:MAG: ABC transporter substrate-binding protein [Chloroflexota bacterium]